MANLLFQMLRSYFTILLIKSTFNSMEMNEISKGWEEMHVIHLMACAHDIVILYPTYKINVVVQILACGT